MHTEHMIMSSAGDTASQDDGSATTLPIRQTRQQLTAGMEHMRKYVVVEDEDHASRQTSKISSPGADAYGVPAKYEPLRNKATGPINAENSSDTTHVDNPQKRSDPFQFGTRYLEEGDDIFAHNAWDHVEVDPQYQDFIRQQTQFQRENQVSAFDMTRFNTQPHKWWDKFYSNNQANFFKDRKWLVQEFPILGQVTKADHGPCTVLEVGAGAGNTAFPLLAMNENAALRIHACDYSAKAIDVIRAQEAYTSQAAESVLVADVWDAAGQVLPPGLEADSVDVIAMIFIFSALAPSQWRQAVHNVWTLLKPGGEILFRDYGRGDLAQVRFKKGRYLEENFYVRGDGTRVYFFEEQELRDIWSGALPTHDNEAPNQDDYSEQARFEIVDLAADRRMLVNRQRKIKMYRCWMQGRFRKPVSNG